MAESLRRLVNLGSFTVLQDKLDTWLSDYHINTADQNASRCADIIDSTTRVTNQLFSLLDICVAEGATYSSSLLRSKYHYPHYGYPYWPHRYPYDGAYSTLVAENSAKDRELVEVQDSYERSLQELETDLKDTQAEADDLQKELDDTKGEMANSRRQSTSDKMFDDQEIRDLRAKLRIAEDEIAVLKARCCAFPCDHRTVSGLREEIAFLRSERDSLYRYKVLPALPTIAASTRTVTTTTAQSDKGSTVGSINKRPDLSDTLPSYRYLPRAGSPLGLDDTTQRVRQAHLISRFNDMFSQDRLDAMAMLRRYCDDHDNNQRVLFVAIAEAFQAARLSFRQYKTRVRSQLLITHSGPDTLEEAVQDYINRHGDVFDLAGIVSDVIRALNRNPRISLPPEASFNIIHNFIREACKLAWQCCALGHPLDVTPASDAELFDDFKYRRSYDSEYSAPLVDHHVWPCLVQGVKILVKGEACTRRGASLSRSRSTTPSRSRPRSRSRSASPSRRSLSATRSLTGI